MFNQFLMSDNRGKKSWHITLGVIWTTFFSLKAVLGGMALVLPGGISINLAVMAASEYLLYVAPWLSAIGMREYLEKIKVTNGSASLNT